MQMLKTIDIKTANVNVVAGIGIEINDAKFPNIIKAISRLMVSKLMEVS